MKIGVFTKPEHLEKLGSYLGANGFDFILSTQKREWMRKDFDIGISYCYPYKIDVEKDGRPWYNYHPAPLPKYKGYECAVDQLNDNVKSSAVSVHRMTNVLDEGKVFKVRKFPLDSELCHSHELWLIAHYHLLQLFKETLQDVIDYESSLI